MFAGIDPIELLIRVPVVLLALTVHEFNHGYFAYRMGDPTAYNAGRMTLNPLKHLDPLGTVCLMFAPIGWAKPVPINPLNFHDRRKGILVSTAAGPVSNLAQAVLFGLVLRGVLLLMDNTPRTQNPHVDQFVIVLAILCQVAVIWNVGLAVFNCLPVYPLDGFHILMQLLPPSAQAKFAETAMFGRFAILGLILIQQVGDRDVLGKLIMPVVEVIFRCVVGRSLGGTGIF